MVPDVQEEKRAYHAYERYFCLSLCTTLLEGTTDASAAAVATGSIRTAGIGAGVGEDRAIEAANQAVLSPLLETSIDGATDAIINVTGGPNLTLFEVEEAVEAIRKSANTDINTIFGAVINENFTDEIIVTVIATGFDMEKDKDASDDVDPIAGLDDEDTVIPSFLRRRSNF